ncbi:hypothetical protein LTR84_010458 [Exophiala bonariae]|uniref:Major facilitator superfamily (MFS) profile domain-containing protein n=1 Tax=Exophiala bonariae TaxID=1690606 RepID=A0AAV9MT52_9EURO|nr:hypothetical protein LTR84_010458 [Exophiala bonariae]
MGFGIINFVFGIPAFYTIDSIGRRSLLLITFPLLAIFQLMTASSFAGNNWRLALAGTYLFGIAYSPGEGPVPFVYAAESMPLYIRDQGMGLVVSINWLFNWLIAFTLPQFINAFHETGAFYYYSGWCVVLWFMIFFLVPETRNLSLEQLDLVFRHHSSRQFAKIAMDKALYNIKTLLRKIKIMRRLRALQEEPKSPRPLYAPVVPVVGTEGPEKSP